MKISAPDWCFFDGSMEPGAYYEALRDLGIAAVEMVLPARHAAARAAGLPILNASGPGIAEGVCDRARHAELVPQLEAVIRTTQSDGVPALIVFSGNGEDAEGGMAACIDVYGPLSELAGRCGVTLLFEMFCLQDHPGYLARGSKFGFELARSINHPAFRIVYDAYHMHQMGEDVVRDVAENVDLIAHLHVAETPHRGALVNGGNLPLAEFLRAAEVAGYDGYVGLEFHTPPPKLDALQRSVDVVQSV